jgi:hypothetical protein
MKFNKVALVFGGAVVLAAGGLAGLACSSSGTGNPIGAPDSSSPDNYTPPVEGGSPDNFTPPPDGGSETGTDGGGEGGTCATTPKLFPGNGTTLYCPFIGDGGDVPDAAGYCTPKTDECCVGGSLDGGGFAPSSCNPIHAACTDGKFPTQIECEDPATDCPHAGDLCCASAATPNTGSVPQWVASCGYYQLAEWDYNKCAATCSNTEVQICATQAECPANTLCTPFRTTKGANLGWCCTTNDAGACPQ